MQFRGYVRCLLARIVAPSKISDYGAKMPHTFLRLPAVKSRTGLSRSTIYLRVTQRTFPRPVSLGGRAVGWVEAEIEEWIARRIELSRAARGAR